MRSFCARSSACQPCGILFMAVIPKVLEISSVSRSEKVWEPLFYDMLQRAVFLNRLPCLSNRGVMLFLNSKFTYHLSYSDLKVINFCYPCKYTCTTTYRYFGLFEMLINWSFFERKLSSWTFFISTFRSYFAKKNLGIFFKTLNFLAVYGHVK